VTETKYSVQFQIAIGMIYLSAVTQARV